MARWMTLGLGVSLAAHGAAAVGLIWVWGSEPPRVRVRSREGGAEQAIAELTIIEAPPRAVALAQEPPGPVEAVKESTPAPESAQETPVETVITTNAAPAAGSSAPVETPARAPDWSKEASEAGRAAARVLAGMGRVVDRAQGALADWGAAARAVGAGEVRSPEPLAGNAPPRYPEECRRRRQEGEVRVRVRVGTDGHAAGARVEASSGVAALDAAAVEAARGWTFSPALERGRPVEADAVVTVRFVLGGSSGGRRGG